MKVAWELGADSPLPSSHMFFFCYIEAVAQQLRDLLWTQAFILCKALCVGVITIVTISLKTFLLTVIQLHHLVLPISIGAK